MPKQVFNNITGAIPPLPAFSQVVVCRGIVYVCGSVGCDNDHNLIGGVHSQIRAALENMKTLLEAAGSDLDHVLKVNVYLANMARDFIALNDVYLEFFNNPETLPARTCVGVAALPLGAYAEIECTAELVEDTV